MQAPEASVRYRMVGFRAFAAILRANPFASFEFWCKV